MLVALGDKGVKTRDDLADLASDELREIVGESAMDNDTANAIIMKAREHWFAAEDADAAASGQGLTGGSTPLTFASAMTGPAS